jgi:hypothetical protein
MAICDLVDLARRHAGTSTGPVAIPATYLQTVAVRRAGLLTRFGGTPTPASKAGGLRPAQVEPSPDHSTYYRPTHPDPLTRREGST